MDVVAYLVAAGAGFGIYLLLALFSGWAPAARYSPVGLMTAGGELLAGSPVSLVWPVATALVIAALAARIAAVLFRRQEI